MNCPCSEWEKIDAFELPSEYDRFGNWIQGQVQDRRAKEVPVQSRYGGFKERWFQCAGCGKTWRLVEHDFPFRGLFEQVHGGTAIEVVQTRNDFVAFVRRMVKDYKNNPKSWENHDLEKYLNALAGWVEDMDGYYSNQGKPMPGVLDWHILSEILTAAKMYV